MLWSDFLPHIRHLSRADQQKTEEALRLAERMHAGQMRESGSPFITHPIAVAQIVARMGGDRDTIIAALLHDTVEDTDLTLEEAEAQFGPGVGAMIRGLTKLDESELAGHPSLDQKIESLRRMFTVMERDVRVMVIKLADRLHNMQTIGFRSPEKQRAVAKETLDVYVKIADRLCMRDLRDELSFLCHAVLEPELHDRLLQVRESNRKRVAALAPVMQKRLRTLAPGLPTDIGFEYKTWENLLLQHELEKESARPTLLYNVVFRCESVEDCYRTLGAIHQAWPRIVLTFDDFINTPAINGYRGLQTTVVLEDGTHVRCKIRTHGMDAYAHRGIAAVCFDAQAKGILDYIPWTRHVRTLSDDTRHRSEEFWATLQSDILSEAFVIYGNENRSVLVPTDATALDGALYLYPERALRLTTVFVNGRQVPLSHPLHRADVLEIDTDEQNHVTREWLHLSHSGIGNALIRTALAEEKWAVKVESGKKILQDHLLQRHRGYLSELNTAALAQLLEQRGITGDLDKLYAQIAEGRVLPQDVERVLYPVAATVQKKRSGWKLRCRVLAQDWIHLYEVIRPYDIQRIRIRNDQAHNVSTMHMRFRLTAEEAQDLERELRRMGADILEFRSSSPRIYLLISLIILLWGLNPVVAKWLMLQDISPLALMSLRSMGFFIFSAILFLAWSQRRGTFFSPIRGILHIAALPAFAAATLSLTTYLSIQLLPPSVHLAVLRLNALLLPAAILQWPQRISHILRWLPLASAAGILLVLFTQTTLPTRGIALALVTLLTYILYSHVMERTLHQYNIEARYPVFLFYVGLILGGIGVLLAPWALKNTSHWLPYLPLLTLYILTCVFIPHVLFHTVLQKTNLNVVTGIYHIEIFVAVLLEIALLGIILQPITYLALGAILLILSGKYPALRERCYV